MKEPVAVLWLIFLLVLAVAWVLCRKDPLIERLQSRMEEEDQPMLSIDRPWNEYPVGTKAHAFNGGYWIKQGDGWWKWHCGDSFPNPGADARWVQLPKGEQ